MDLDFFAGFAGKQAVDLDFFKVILDLSRVDLDFFAGFVGRRGGKQIWPQGGQTSPILAEGGGGVSNEGLLDLMSVDLVFSGLRADISGKIDLSCVDLVFSGLRADLLDLSCVDLVFCRPFRLVSCGLRLFCRHFTSPFLLCSVWT